MTLAENTEDLQFQFRLPDMHCGPAAIGSLVDAFGVVATELNYDGSTARSAAELFWSHGEIKSFLPGGARGSLIPFAVFESNAPFKSGMSGGPVFSEDGVVFGMVCYDCGPNLDDPAAEPISYISLLLPMLGSLVEIDCPETGQKVSRTVLELVQLGIVPMVGSETVRLHRSEDGTVRGIEIIPL